MRSGFKLAAQLGDAVEVHAPGSAVTGSRTRPSVTCSMFSLEARAAPARGAQHRLHPDLGQEGGQADDQVLLAVDHRLLAREVLVAVHHGVQQAAPLVGVARRGFLGRLLTRSSKASNMASLWRRPMGRPRLCSAHAAALLQVAARLPGIPASSRRTGWPLAPPIFLISARGVPPLGQDFVAGSGRGVQGARVVGQQGGLLRPKSSATS